MSNSMDTTDDRLTNVLNKAIKLSKDAHAAEDPQAAKELLSYVIGSLEAAVELIRPDAPQQVIPKKPFIKQLGL